MTDNTATAAPPRFLCIGECMGELAPLETPGDYRLGFAGDTFNTAWYLRQLRPDAPVSFLSAVGSDDLSERMLGFMAHAGVGTEHVARHPGRSAGLYMITLREGERSFSYWRETSAARLLASDETALANAAASADLIYFSGITLAILTDAARERLLGVLLAARAGGGKTIVFDPNLRPRLWPDTARMRAAVMQGAAVSDITLPSHDDEAAHFGDRDPQATADRYAGAGAATVVVKNGAGAVYYIDHGARGTVPVAPSAHVVDTTAAGDSFNAAFLATVGAGLAMPARIGLAASVAGQVIGGKGALITLQAQSLAGWRALCGAAQDQA